MSILRTWAGVLAPLSKDEGEVNILDLVMHHGRTRRFGGYGDPEWTVLHHKVLCAFISMRLGYGPEVTVHVLGHDDHEAYTGDIPSPVKMLINEMAGKNVMGSVEGVIDGRIQGHLGTEKPDAATRKKIKQCDQIALVLESLLFGPTGCDLMTVVPEEDRADMMSLVEQVVPNYQALVRRKHAGR